MKYYVTITRVESFTIEAKNEEEAVDIAFDNAGEINPKTLDWLTTDEIIEHDQDTVDHSVEEVSS